VLHFPHLHAKKYPAKSTSIWRRGVQHGGAFNNTQEKEHGIHL